MMNTQDIIQHAHALYRAHGDKAEAEAAQRPIRQQPVRGRGLAQDPLQDQGIARPPRDLKPQGITARRFPGPAACG
jgi:hypothetical protein